MTKIKRPQKFILSSQIGLPIESLLGQWSIKIQAYVLDHKKHETDTCVFCGFRVGPIVWPIYDYNERIGHPMGGPKYKGLGQSPT